jgi:ABC-2 type transport system ATP-binding protein
MSFAIETAGLGYRAGRSFAISGVDLRVPAGEVCGFLGPNGAGKTTVIRLLLGLLRAGEGRITLLGLPMPQGAEAILARVGYVPERPHFDLTLTVEEILRFQAAFYRTWDRALALDLARRLEVDLGKEFGRLSKGQKAKVLIISALAQRPELLLLDEPTDGLDPVVRREILDILLGRIREDGMSALMSSHLVHELEGLCTRIAIMDGGALVAETRMEEFRDGIRRVVVRGDGGALPTGLPFTLLDRRPLGADQTQWTVQGWGAGAGAYVATHGIQVLTESAVGLEEAYVHLLRSARRGRAEAA